MYKDLKVTKKSATSVFVCETCVSQTGLGPCKGVCDSAILWGVEQIFIDCLTDEWGVALSDSKCRMSLSRLIIASDEDSTGFMRMTDSCVTFVEMRKLTTERGPPLDALPRMTSFHLNMYNVYRRESTAPYVTLATLPHVLRDCKTCVNVTISKVAVDLSVLRKMPWLESLHMAGKGWNNRRGELAHLASMPQLRSLQIPELDLAEGFDHLAMPCLEELQIQKADAQDLSFVLQWPRLHTFHVSLGDFVNLSPLTKSSISTLMLRCAFHNVMGHALGAMPQLRHLEVECFEGKSLKLSRELCGLLHVTYLDSMTLRISIATHPLSRCDLQSIAHLSCLSLEGLCFQSEGDKAKREKREPLWCEFLNVMSVNGKPREQWVTPSTPSRQKKRSRT